MFDWMSSEGVEDGLMLATDMQDFYAWAAGDQMRRFLDKFGIDVGQMTRTLRMFHRGGSVPMPLPHEFVAGESIVPERPGR